MAEDRKKVKFTAAFRNQKEKNENEKVFVNLLIEGGKTG